MIIQNTVVMTFLARGGNAIATMGRISGGMLNIGKAAQSTNRQLSLTEQQMRALGTTLRYAFAGTLVFGLTSMIGKLSQLQQQMGLISAIAGPSGVNLTGGALSDLQDELSSKAVDARTNLADLNASVINFLSTVQGAKKGQIADIVAEIGMTARLSQTPTEDLTRAVTTLNIAAGRKNNLENINALLREWFQLISTAPGGIAAAPQIAQQLGPLAAVSQLGRLTPEQLFGFSLGSLRFGATPSTALRGTQFFLQSLFQPVSEDAKKEMKKAGFTPERLQQVGGAQFALDYLRYVKQLGGRPTEGGVRRFGVLADQNLDIEAELAPNVNIPGISPDALAFLRTTLGRIHGIRTAAVLLRQLSSTEGVASLNETMQTMLDIKNEVGPEAKQLQKAADRYRRATPLQSAAIALDTLRATISRDIAPILGFVSEGITAGAEGLRRNDNLRKGIFAGIAGLAGLYGFNRIFRGGKGLPFRTLFGTGPGQMVVGAQAVENLASGDVPKGTATDPMFVIVVGQIFGGRKIPIGAPMPPRTGGETAARTGRLARLAPWAALAATRFGGPAMLATLPLTMAGDTAQRQRVSTRWWQVTGRQHYPELFHLLNLPRGHFMRERYKDVFEKAFDPKTNLDKLTRDYKRMLKDPMGQSPAVQQFLAAANLPEGLFRAVKVSPEGEITLNIRLHGKGGKVIEKRVHVPAAANKGGNVPSSRGKRTGVTADFDISKVLPEWITG